MDNNEKLTRLLEALGPGADPALAREVLEANAWNLSEALNLLVGDAAPEPQRAAMPAQQALYQPPAMEPPAATARIPAPLAPTGTFATGTFGRGLAANQDDDVRAPMRTGFHETLLSADPVQERRQEEEREAYRKKIEAERIAAEERARQQEEERYNKGLARLAEEQRSTAEKQALERKKQKMEEEQARARQRRNDRRRDDSEEEEEDLCVAPPMLLADLSAQLAGVEAAPAPEPPPAPPPAPSRPMDDDKELEDIPVAPSVPLSDLAAAVGTGEEAQPSEPPEPPAAPVVPAAPAAPAAPATVPAEPQEPATSTAMPPAEASPRTSAESKVTDPVLQALKDLRRRYREADPASLAAALRIVSGCVGHLVTHPQETKYHRINCAGERFRTRVESLDGAVAVLEACGFQREGDSLLVQEDYPRTHGLQLRDAKAKVDVVLGELEAAGYTG
ncbi:UBXN6 [Symbiodinium natans]|uniref:UBXN6 protein n=1 Tax=Symbiodinium natans TaxID=878477 RepID=A0A812ID09_9DINO|nr:UBXN6 [Symbiodinium natans]